PPALTLIATLRSGAVDTNPAMRLLPQMLQRLGDRVTTLYVDRLPRRDAQAFAAALLRRTPSSAQIDPGQLAEEARGHPLYIDELARHQASAASGTVEVMRLDEALWSRAWLLDPPERQTLATLAVAGGPLAEEVVERASDLPPNAFHRALAVLRAEHLARTTGPEKSDLVECYHDRVREAIAAHLDSAEQR